MDAPKHSSHDARVEAERKLLAALCQADLDDQTRMMIVLRLKSHTFAEPDHKIVFRALETLPAAERDELHGALARALTRLGFPDVDLKMLFDNTPPRPDQIAALLENL
jgi:hypothetical protein